VLIETTNVVTIILKLGSGYSTRSSLLVLNAIQLVRLFAKLIGDF